MLFATAAGALGGWSASPGSPHDAGSGAAEAPTSVVQASDASDAGRIPEGHVALAVASGDPPLPAAAGDTVDVLAVDPVVGDARVVARAAIVLEAHDASLLVAVRRADLVDTAGAVGTGMAVAVLVP